MRNLTWGDVSDLKYGKSLREYPNIPSEECRFRVFGTNGPIGWHSTPLVDAPGIIIGRKGAYRGVHYSSQPFFVIDTAYYLHILDSQIDTKWAFYQLSTVDINRMDSGSAIPSTKREDFYAVPVSIPSLADQRRIADILTAYDDLIENNRRRMALLEESARQLYREWFVRLRYPGRECARKKNGLPTGWTEKKLGDVLTLKRGYDLPSASRSEGEIPIVSSSGITGFHSEKKASAPGVVTGRYGTLGDVYFIDQDYWPLNTALYVSDFKGNPVFLILHLLKHELQSIQSDKAAIPGLNRNVVHDRTVVYPPKPSRDRFSEIAEPIYRQISGLAVQNQKLRAARDHLLPRLLSGELVV